MAKFLTTEGIVESLYRIIDEAECYLNENEALLTSMNIGRASQERNHEMGILVSKVAITTPLKPYYRNCHYVLRGFSNYNC